MTTGKNIALTRRTFDRIGEGQFSAKEDSSGPLVATLAAAGVVPGLVQGSGWAQHHAWPICGVAVGPFTGPPGNCLVPGCVWASLVAQRVKHLPAIWETWVQSPGWEDPLEKEMAIHSSTLAWKTPWTEETGRLQSLGSQRVTHD